jgi:hypothetical protein
VTRAAEPGDVLRTLLAGLAAPQEPHKRPQPATGRRANQVGARGDSSGRFPSRVHRSPHPTTLPRFSSDSRLVGRNPCRAQRVVHNWGKPPLPQSVRALTVRAYIAIPRSHPHAQRRGRSLPRRSGSLHPLGGTSVMWTSDVPEAPSSEVAIRESASNTRAVPRCQEKRRHISQVPSTYNPVHQRPRVIAVRARARRDTRTSAPGASAQRGTPP